MACGNGVLVPRIQPVRAGHPLRSLRSASPSLREGEVSGAAVPERPLGSLLQLVVVVPDLVGEGEGLGLAAGVDEDDWGGRI